MSWTEAQERYADQRKWRRSALNVASTRTEPTTKKHY